MTSRLFLAPLLFALAGGASAADPAKPAAPAQDPAWMSSPTRMNEWVAIKGNGKAFVARADEYRRFLAEAPKKEDASLALYEGEIPPSGWMPSWEAVKKYAIWMTGGTVTKSEYRLSYKGTKEKDGTPTLFAVKGNEKVQVYDLGTGTRFTLAKITVAKPKDPAAPQSPRRPATPGERTGGPREPTVRLPAPEKIPPITVDPGKRDTAPVETSQPGAWTPDLAAMALFPDEAPARDLVLAIVGNNDTDKLAFAKEIGEINGNPEKLAAARTSWKDKMKAACVPKTTDNSAMAQAEALAARGTPDGSASPEAAAAQTSFDTTPGPFDELCKRWQGAPRLPRRPRVRLSPPSQQISPEAGMVKPPAPNVAAEQAGAPADSKGSGTKSKLLSGGILGFIMMIVMAAVGAAVGSIGGPVAGLIGLAAGAGFGYYMYSKMKDADKKK